MFFSKEMTELELIIPSKDLLAATKVLSGRGIFHQTDSNYPGSGSVNSWAEKAAAYSALERRIQIQMQSLLIEENQPPQSEFDAMVELEQIRPMVEEIENEVRQVADQLAGERKRLEQFESALHHLEPVAEVDLDVNLFRKSRYLFSTLGQIPSANVDRLQTSLGRVPHVLLTLRSDAQKPVVWLAGTQSNADVFDRAARSAYLNPLILPEGYQGTPAQIIGTLRGEIDGAKKNIAGLEQALKDLGRAHEKKLRQLLWQAHTSRALADAIVRFGQLKYTYVVTGWVPTDGLEDLTLSLKAASKEILIETAPTKRSGFNSNVPVALQQSKFLQPFQMLVNTYARPRYGELDPTILIAITFPLLFGAMFGDIGQGLTLALLGWLVANKKIKALSGMASLGGLVAICGLSAIFFGFLYGSVFGFEDVSIFGIALKPLWISPIHHILNVLMVAVGAGVILLFVGFLIGIFNYAISQNWGHLWFGHNGVAGFVLYLSLLGFGASALQLLPVSSLIFIASAAVSALAVMFSELFIRLAEGYRPLIDGGIGIYIIQAGVELFEVMISLLSNTLSYVRVGAFAVAHGGLSAAIFILAGLAANGLGAVGYWFVVIVGNLFIVGFEGLIVGIQTMRLSYYEFFGKFFTGGGMRFEPLALNRAKDE